MHAPEHSPAALLQDKLYAVCIAFQALFHSLEDACPLPLLGGLILQGGKLVRQLLPAFLPALQAHLPALPGILELLLTGIGAGQQVLTLRQLLAGALQLSVPAAGCLPDLLQAAVGILQQRLARRSREPGIVDLLIDRGAPELPGFDLPVQLSQRPGILFRLLVFLRQAAADLRSGLFQRGNALPGLSGCGLVGVGVEKSLPVFGFQ